MTIRTKMEFILVVDDHDEESVHLHSSDDRIDDDDACSYCSLLPSDCDESSSFSSYSSSYTGHVDEDGDNDGHQPEHHLHRNDYPKSMTIASGTNPTSISTRRQDQDRRMRSISRRHHNNKQAMLESISQSIIQLVEELHNFEQFSNEDDDGPISNLYDAYESDNDSVAMYRAKRMDKDKSYQQRRRRQSVDADADDSIVPDVDVGVPLVWKDGDSIIVPLRWDE
jgi:hypothetical protein